jgi:hypothetical protein
MAKQQGRSVWYLGEFEPLKTGHWNRICLRNIFLREIEVAAPAVLSTLYSNVFLPYRSLFPFHKNLLARLIRRTAMHSFNKTFPSSTLTGAARAKAAKIHYRHAQLTTDASLSFWPALEMADGADCQKLVDLRKAILDWSDQWNLNADWCRDRAVRQMQTGWLQDPDREGWVDDGFYLSLRLFGPDSVPVFRNAQEAASFCPKEFPLWPAFLMRQRDYLRMLERDLRNAIEKDPAWSWALSRPHLKSHVNNLIKVVLEDVRQNHCERVARHYAEKGFERIGKRSRMEDHINWTVRVRVLSQTSDQIATMLETVAREAYLTINGVRKAVRETLIALELPMRPTFRPARGRPKRAVDSQT